MADQGSVRVAVTGATGFIGVHLVERLRQQGTHLNMLVRQPIDTAADDGFRPCVGDLLQQDSLDALVEGTATVLHLAAYAHASRKPTAAEIALHRRINLEGTQNLFRSAVQAGVERFVFVSSVKAGGEHPRDCLDEDSRLIPGDPYSLIKRETEAWLFEQGARLGVAVAVVRPALVYGPGVKGNLAAMLRGIDRGWFPPVPETHNRRSMVSVQDVVSALLAAATRPEAAGQVCILTDGEAYSTRRLYRAMASALGRPAHTWGLPVVLLRGLGWMGDAAEAVTRRQMPLNSRLITRLLDSACYRSLRAEGALGFHPRYRLEDLLPEMVAAYRRGKGMR